VDSCSFPGSVVDGLQQLHAETAEANRTVAKLETEVTAMSTASQQGVLTQQSQLESTKIV
jgi:kinetochore protein NDC80